MAQSAEVILIPGERHHNHYKYTGAFMHATDENDEDLVAFLFRAWPKTMVPGVADACTQIEYTTIAMPPSADHPLAAVNRKFAAKYPAGDKPSAAYPRRGVEFGGVKLPECAWWRESGRPTRMCLAHGQGELSDLLSGATLYTGSWEYGMRHGRGRGLLLSRTGEVLGSYEGDWLCGMRHGKGCLVDEGTGAKWEGAWVMDKRHGPGTEVLPGGGTYRGSWCRGKRHGCGVFSWPTGRAEVREYDGGAMVAARAVQDGGLQGASGIHTPAMSRISSRFDLLTLQQAQQLQLQQQGYGAGASDATGGGAMSATTPPLPAGVGAEGYDAASVNTAPFPAGTSTGDAGDGLGLGLGLGGLDSSGYLLQSGMGANTLGQALGMGMTVPVAVPVPVAGGPGVQFAVQLPLAPPGTVSGGSSGSGVGGVSSITLHLNADVVRLLKHSSVTDLPRPRDDVITVDMEDRLDTALTRMTDNNVLSLPVRHSGSSKYTGVVHLLDVCAFLLDMVAKKKATFSPVAGGLRETLAHQKRFASATVSEVLEMTQHLAPTAFKPLPAGSPLIFAAHTLAEGVHAVPIVDAEGKIVRMLTQADVIRFLASHVDELGPLGQVTIGQLLPELALKAAAGAAAVAAAAAGAAGAGPGAGGLVPASASTTQPSSPGGTPGHPPTLHTPGLVGQGMGLGQGQGTPAQPYEQDHTSGGIFSAPLIVARFNDRAMEVMQRLRAASCPAAAVVDAYGGMVANLSLSDLKAVAKKANFSALSLPVQAFLGALDRGSEVMNPSIVVRAATPLSSVLLTLAATRIHQLYFVDEQLRPVAAIRTGDVLRVLVGSRETT